MNTEDFTAAVTRRDDGRAVVTLSHWKVIPRNAIFEGAKVVDATAAAVFDAPARISVEQVRMVAAKHADVLLTVAHVAEQMPVNEG